MAEEVLSRGFVKIVLVGDGTVGKTCLLLRYSKKKFDDCYIPTVCDNCDMKVNLDEKEVKLSLWDTAGQEDYDRIRPLSYGKTDCFILVFSVVAPDSFTNITSKWIPEIKHHAPGTSYVLVGNKSDLKTDRETLEQLSEIGKNVVAEEDGINCAKQIGASKFLESSAKTGDGVKEVFETAIRAGLVKKSGKKRKCVII